MNAKLPPSPVPPRRGVDISLEIIALAGLVALFAASFIGFSGAARIPIHFGLGGEPDRYGSSWDHALLAGVGLVLYLLLAFLSRRSQQYNYPLAVTPENASRIYALGRRMSLSLNAIIIWMLVYVVVTARRIAAGDVTGLTPYFVPVLLLLVFGCVLGHVVAMARSR